MGAAQPKDTKKIIWGLAKGLGLHKEELYSVLFRETQKDSMRACTEKELRRVVQALVILKEETKSRPGMASNKQIWKIRQLEKELGWDDNPKRLTSFLRKWYGVERPEWLSSRNAWKAIESLKKVLEKGINNGSREEVQDNL
jgi:hypothetical protein